MSKNKFSDETLLSLIDALPIGLLLVTKGGEIILSNPKVEELFGFDAGELLGYSINKLVPKRYRKPHEKMRVEFMNSPSLRAMDHGRILPALKKNRQEIQVEIGLTPLVLSNNDYVLVSIIEVSNRILKVAAYNDPLTGLPNRNLFKELSGNLRNVAIRNRARLTLMFIDLDGFKHVNDQYGHDVGDLVLCEIAGILYKSVRKNDIAGRIGGDEFMVCLYGVENDTDLQNISNHIIKNITSIQNVKGYTINIGASIGAVSTGRPDKIQLDEMIKKADKLMYKAKKAGKGRLVSGEC